MTSETHENVPQQVLYNPLAALLWGGYENLTRRAEVVEVLRNNKIFDKRATVTQTLARKDAWLHAVELSFELVKIKREQKWSYEHFRDAVGMVDDLVPIQTQYRIFLENLKRLMSDSQQAVWVPKAENCEILGGYAQTEIGHGSNVSGLETTATFDHATDSFIINSPTVSSAKYWISSTGIWVNFALVVARLIINGASYGNHIFLTQLRDLRTHEPLPGIEIYEIGPKVFQGMTGIDNGAIMFHKVRVPRAQLCSRDAQVQRDGTYVPPTNRKHALGSMITIRTLIAQTAGYELLKAVTIAYYYTNFRKQFGMHGSREEVPVYQHSSVKHRILPLLAKGIAVVLCGHQVGKDFKRYSEKAMRTGDTSGIQQLFLQTLAAKIYATDTASKGVEICRIACGGHGYHAFSGFGRLYAHTVNAVTYEGDNVVLAQQVPKAILREAKSADQASNSSSLPYVKQHGRIPILSDPRSIKSTNDWLREENQSLIHNMRMAMLLRRYASLVDRSKDASHLAHIFAMAHSDLVYCCQFRSVVEKAGEGLSPPLEAALNLFSLSITLDSIRDLGPLVPLDSKQIELLDTAYSDAVQRVATHAPTIIKALGFTDFELNSLLARPDQDPYTALFNAAKHSEMTNLKEAYPRILELTKIWATMDKPKLEAERSKL